ncbi:hypothetical protein Mlute_02761 [Meiothermus luteus]|uniref:Uncharacterized protein n=1 Tax=Meiothermus luteus TaxID=2026184 RepID=A0A399EDE2_9DEIN|nr:hypothetical protein Mlute_02761 [Meiothermus luteus]
MGLGLGQGVELGDGQAGEVQREDPVVPKDQALASEAGALGQDDGLGLALPAFQPDLLELVLFRIKPVKAQHVLAHCQLPPHQAELGGSLGDQLVPVDQDGGPVGPGHHPFRKGQRSPAQHQAAQEEDPGRPQQRDAASLHHHKLVFPGQAAKGQHDREQRGDGQSLDGGVGHLQGQPLEDAQGLGGSQPLGPGQEVA